MPVFRRSNAGESDSKAAGDGAERTDEAPGKTKQPTQAGKGRPTPKRSEAERNRYRSIKGGTTSGRATTTTRDPGRKLTPEEKAREKSRIRSDRDKRMQAMRRGEDWALSPRDQGPRKKLARDYVDSHRRPSEFYMYALLVLLVALFTRSTVIESYVGPLVFVLIAVIVIDAYFISRALRKLVAERFPGQSTRGLTWYAVMRAMQIRRFRNPQPSVRPGDKI
jgi:Protein of unknown function (DUF3043)